MWLRPTLDLSLTLTLIVLLAACGANAGSPRAPAGLEVSPFHDNPNNAIVRVVTGEPRIALTFDDGPDRRYTPPLLRLLDREGLEATFFVIGRRARAERDLVARELRDGHEVANHTLTHPVLTSLDAAAIAAEIAAGARAVESAGGRAPALFRPPLGAFDERVGAEAARLGEPMIGWDLPLDRYLGGGDVRAAVGRLLDDARPGSIVLIHAERKRARARTMRALRLLIEGLRERGLSPVTVSELLRSAGRA